ncbi:Rieske 2Fe-2S domain-containing protein [Brevibacillus parabrevis]|uniref:Rieske 2Fe-2S domain-containing protein n=1 Tax=Brevibacillus parabrevis TaxID=54914 RepID=UPI002E1DF6A2|nr:Rieske 2Fe-2S domain-containing protein [Brevibacillus parabrevis]MED2255219.1 Rieske 2Fe-2S domain-containing protein [Brevibacillus parabrevis]
MLLKKIQIGSENNFNEFPLEIELEGSQYFLTKDVTGYKLLSTTCPHAGGKVVHQDSCFNCPIHGWKFDYSGESINVPSQKLGHYNVFVENGVLFAEIPQPIITNRPKQNTSLEHDLIVRLHSHACLEFTYNDFSLLTDPWLVGPAFLGAWLQYPSPIVDANALTPSAIWISHEHSDHFHEPTLKYFNRKTPIYFPDFPNKRLEEKLTQLGFLNIYPMQFGRTYQIGTHYKITCFEPSSLWNDAILLIEIDGFRVLNLNDAGLNPRIAQYIGPVDVVASGFSPGASGYPLTWTHLDEAKKDQILENSRLGLLKMLTQAVDLYGAKSLIPFASHFNLWHPTHRNYVKKLRKNTVMDVVEAFKDTAINVIDLLPGDYWNVKENNVTYAKRDRSKLYDQAEVLAYLDKTYRDDHFLEHHPNDYSISTTEVEDYFMLLNKTSEIAYCEDLRICVKVTNIESNQHYFEVYLEIEKGILKILRSERQYVNLTIELPANILKKIIAENLSWDEAHIGYWCKFSRNPDIYHAGFWRLLQTPYLRKSPQIWKSFHPRTITGDTVIADVLEFYGDDADRILRRYGLYCLGCHHSTSESISIGARNHGLNDADIDKMLLELKKAFLPEEK